MTQGTSTRKTLSPGDSDIGQGRMQRKMLSPGRGDNIQRDCFANLYFSKFGELDCSFLSAVMSQ